MNNEQSIAAEQDAQVRRCVAATKARRNAEGVRGHVYCRLDENSMLMNNVGDEKFRAAIYALVDTLVEQRETVNRATHNDGLSELMLFKAGTQYVRIDSSFVGTVAFVDIYSGLIYPTKEGITDQRAAKPVGDIYSDRGGLECFGHDGRLKKQNGE